MEDAAVQKRIRIDEGGKSVIRKAVEVWDAEVDECITLQSDRRRWRGKSKVGVVVDESQGTRHDRDRIRIQFDFLSTYYWNQRPSHLIFRRCTRCVIACQGGNEEIKWYALRI